MKIDGVKVKDATKKLDIVITKNDIKKGGNKDPSACAAAQCLLRLPNVSAARVHLKRTFVKQKNSDHWLRYNTPSALRSEIVAFDRGGTFQPGVYTLRTLSKSEKLTGKRTGGPDKPRKRASNKRPYHVLTNVRSKISAYSKD